VQVSYNNNFQKSRKIYGVQAAAVKFNIKEAYLANSLNVTKQGRRYSALACMANEGTVLDDTTPTTKDNVVEKIIAMRQAVKDNHGQANFILASTTVYAAALQVLGLKSTEDPAIKHAQLMERFGLNIIECNSFDKANVKYYNYAGELQTVDLTGIEMICGYYEAFKLEDNFAMYRLIDSENFAGSKAQVEYNTAMRVVSPKQIIVKKKTSVARANAPKVKTIDEMTKAELIEYAKTNNIEIDESANKDVILAAIKATKNNN
jgi:hypothetical protein